MMKPVLFFLVSAFLLLVSFVVYMTTPELWPEYADAQALIKNIEEFKKQNHRLPSDIKEVSPGNWKVEGPPYYEKKDETSYEVSFGLASVGESYIYDSRTKKWY